ncbi:WD-REPEATS-REGION domain-containing protein [Mycena venus]|uniref:WD-REPEATS-REGION domain-containing protein n=1 Tax=Mycena venus TaxID=2733690 RepID=A0A8H6Z399_9AGAR|nr:WD-REPEATS-REGION domain-containing protein [Mycena venus]
MNILDNSLPLLRVAQAAAAGNPRLNDAIAGVVALAEMVSIKGNKADLPELAKRLKQMTEVDTVECSNDLKERLDTLNKNLKPITPRLTSLEKQLKFMQFLKRKKYETEIQGIKASIASHIQDFTFHNNISIKILVDQMSTKVDRVDRSVQRMEPQGDQHSPSGGDGGQDQTLSVNNYIFGGTGGPGGGGSGQGTGGDGGSGMGPTVNYTINTVENLTTVNSNHVQPTLAKIKYVLACYNAPNTPDKCMEGTRIDIIQDIIAHLTTPSDPSQRIVMLSGSAGTGKSTIAKTVASILAEEQYILAASFFFSRNYAERREINGLPLTLAHQLADYNAYFKNILVKFLDEDRTRILDADPKLQFQKLVVDLLAQIPTSDKLWVICLDALDECGQDRGQIFLRWLSDNIRKIPVHVCFFLTGRPDVPSYLKHDTLCSVMHGINLDTIDKRTVRQDIRTYVERSLDGNSWTPRYHWIPQMQDVEMITSRADGLFVFAATAVRYIHTGLPRVNPQKSLEYLFKGTTLVDLHELYFYIVNEAIPVSADIDDRDQESYAFSIRTLSTILELLEPMEPKDLAALLDSDEDSVRGTLIPLSAVVRVPETGTVQLIHLSFREFMTTQKSRLYEKREDLLCGTEKQKQEFASKVLQTLQTELKFNICDLPTSHLKNTEMPGFEQKLNTCIPRYLRYCCSFWADHLAAVSINAENSGMAKRFLETKSLFWLEVLSLLGMASTASPALSKFIAWSDDPRMRYLAADVKRFLRFFLIPITQSTPHLYVSALAFAPMQSEVGTRFRSQFPELLSILTGQMEKWPAALGVLEGHTGSVKSVAFGPDGKHIVSGSNDHTVCLWDAESGAPLGDPLKGHTDWVTSVAFSPDGKHIVSGSNDHTVRLWDAESGAPRGDSLKGHTDLVTLVAFSPDGKHIVSGSNDHTMRLWDVESGAPLGDPLKGHTGWVTSVAFSPDGKHIVSGSDDHTVCIWDAESGAPLGDPLKGHSGWVTSVTFSPDGKHIVSGSDDHTMRLWDAESGAPLGDPLKGHTGSIRSVAFSPDGKHIVSGSDDQTVHLWDAESGAPLGDPLKGHTHLVTLVAFSPDGKHIVSGSYDCTMRLWDAESGAPLGDPLKGHIDYVRSVAFSPDGKHIVSGSDDHTVRLWDAESGEPLRDQLKGHTGSVKSVAFSPDGKHIVSGSNDHTVHLWDAESGAPLGDPLKGHTGSVASVAFSPDGKRIVSGSDDHTVRLWDAETRAPLRDPLIGHNGWVRSVAFSPDGNHIVSGSNDHTVHLWDAESGAPLGDPLKGHTGPVTSVAFSPDGKHIVSGSNDHTVCLWDAESGAPLGDPLKGHTEWVRSVAFSPDGKHIVSGSNDHTMRLWDAESGAPPGDPLKHTGWARSVAFSPDGKYIVSGSTDHTVRLWDAESGAPLGDPLEGHSSFVTSVAFSPDGKHVVSGSDDHTVRLWDAKSGAPLGDSSTGHTGAIRSPHEKHIFPGSWNSNMCLQDTHPVAQSRPLPFQSGFPLSYCSNSIKPEISHVSPYWTIQEGWVLSSTGRTRNVLPFSTPVIHGSLAAPSIFMILRAVFNNQHLKASPSIYSANTLSEEESTPQDSLYERHQCIVFTVLIKSSLMQ